MTLLELLRRELPKRGGWPEGADYCVQHAHDLGFCWVIFNKGTISSASADAEGMWDMDWNFSRDRDFCADELASDHATAIVTREQYGWDGVSLPPVGCDVEYNCYPDGWVIINIVARIEGATFIEWKSGTHKGGDIIRGDFPFERVRPLRTEAERAIDEMVQLSGVSTGAAKILYDAGYRK